MKLAPREVLGFMKQQKWRNIPLLVFFGHANAVMRNHVEEILQNAEIDRSDAFSFLRLYGVDIQRDPALLLHEATSSNLMQRKRWLVVQGKASELETITNRLLQDDMQYLLGENVLLLIIQDLSTKSSILKRAASLDWVAAIPCYEVSSDMLFEEIRLFCQRNDVRATQETENILLECAENDLSQLKHLLEKVSLYGFKGTLEPETVLACHGHDHQSTLQEFTFAVFSGKVEKSDQLLRGLLEQKIPPVTLIRTLSQHCMKIQNLHSLAAQHGLDQAMKLHRPPIFFKLIPQIREHCQNWSTEELRMVIQQLVSLEVKEKSSEFSDPILLRQFVLRVARTRRRSSALQT